MSDVNISKYRAQVVRAGSTPASPGFAVAEGQNPVDPSGSGQTHLPVTIATATTGLSITESQILSGAGLVSQYIRGDGSLADFPASTGGGSSVSYYLNGSVSQGTIGGVAYKQLNRTPVFGAGTDFTINADGYIASFITDASDPNKLLIPAGNWNFETYFSASSNGGSPSFYVELYKYDGTTFTLIATSSSAPELIAFGTSLNPYYSTLAVPQTTLALTDRLAIRYYVTHSGRTITLHTEDNHLCQIITTFTTGLTALNGLTAQVQNFAVGTSGTDFAIASATATHTFNLPTASATNRGALSSADWTTFNNKTSNLGTVTSVGLSSATSGVTIGSTPVTTSGTITLAIATASGSLNGLLSSTDWTTFNGKQNALTNPVTGTGTTNYLPKFTGASTIGDSNIEDSGTLVTVGVAATFSSSVTAGGNITTSLSQSSSTNINVTNTNASNGAFAQISAINSGASQIDIIAFGSGSTGTIYGITKASLKVIRDNSLTASSNGLAIGTDADVPFYVFTNSSERIRVTNSGNVGIGLTIPLTKLSVKGTAANPILATYNGIFGLETVNQTSFQMGIGTTFNGTWFQSYNQPATGGGTFSLVFNPLGGNVLIGTTTDNGAKLQVSGQLSIIDNTNNSPLNWSRTGGPIGYLYSDGDNVGISNVFDFGAGYEGILLNTSSSSINFFTNGVSTPRLTIASTGAATFSSSVTSSFGSTAANFNSNGATTGAVNAYRISNTTGIASFGIDNSTGGDLTTGGLAYATILQSISNTALQFGTNQTARLTISTTGNVLIGTTTNGSSKLRLVGLPTSSAGLSSGDVYSLAGTLMIA